MFDFLQRRQPRTQHVVVAVVYDPTRKKFLVVFNPRWGGYTFPLRRKHHSEAADALRDREHAIRDARQAILKDFGPTLGEAAEAHWMDRIQVKGVSGRTKEPTLYVYDIVTLILARPLPDGVFGSSYGYLTADEIRDSDPDELGPNSRMVTWTTWQVLTKLLDNQQVSVAIVPREGTSGREYLMTRNRLGLWFFPATRMGDQVPAEQLVVYEFRIKADYLRKIDPGETEMEVELSQSTAHLGPRDYTFYLRKLGFPEEDLTLRGNRLEVALSTAGIDFKWLSEGYLRIPRPDVSHTVLSLLDAAGELD